MGDDVNTISPFHLIEIWENNKLFLFEVDNFKNFKNFYTNTDLDDSQILNIKCKNEELMMNGYPLGLIDFDSPIDMDAKNEIDILSNRLMISVDTLSVKIPNIYNYLIMRGYKCKYDNNMIYMYINILLDVGYINDSDINTIIDAQYEDILTTIFII